MDAYALGATLWVMLFRRNPNGRNILHDVESKQIAKIHSVLLSALLNTDPLVRMSVHRVLHNLGRSDKGLKVIIDTL